MDERGRRTPEVRIPSPADGIWDDRLRTLLRDARRTLVERPQPTEDRATIDGGALQLLQQGTFGSEASRLADAVVGLLREAGFHTHDLHTCFVTLFIFVTGYVDTTEQIDAHLAAPASRSSAEIFELGVQALIEGLKALLPRATSPARPAPRR